MLGAQRNARILTMSFVVNCARSPIGSPAVLPRFYTAYHQALAQRAYHADSGQERGVAALDGCATALMSFYRRPRWRRWRQIPPRGVYLHGPVGRGKTFLMDVFFQQAFGISKHRCHFQQWMHLVHQELHKHRGARNPLTQIARGMHHKALLWCLDECFVEDIGDAMLLHGLLAALFACGITLVITSNCAPCDLYRDGLQRARFLPAIALLKRLQVVMLDGTIDYRQQAVAADGDRYLVPAGAWAHRQMQDWFTQRYPESQWQVRLIVNHRPLIACAVGHDGVWFDFMTLCESARSAVDYLQLVQRYRIFLLSDIPYLDDANAAAARRLIAFIDVLYDHQCALRIAAAAEPELLYRGTLLAGIFPRASSRLMEMRTDNYWRRINL